MIVSISTRPLPKHRKRGPRGVLSPTQQVEAWAWFQAKRHLGTFKMKARELGVTECCLRSVIKNMRRRAGEL